jgi:hypothetical protein
MRTFQAVRFHLSAVQYKAHLLGEILKYCVGVAPSVFRKAAMNALGVL